MNPLTLKELATIIGGELDPTDPQVNEVVTGMATDSRAITPGQCFVPIVAIRDGHAFIASAREQGAVGYLCAKTHPMATQADRPAGAIFVDDPLDALTRLGQWHRDTINPTVVCVTGSNGKTTTKDFIYSALRSSKETVATKGSFNNEIGMPLTLCDLTPTTEVLVSEIGARGIGHIAQAMPILRPDIGVVTTIGNAHVDAFGSEAHIAQAKGELVEALTPAGLAILNADNPACLALANRTPARVITVGTGQDADLKPDDLTINAQGHVEMVLDGQTLISPLAGVHQSTNLLAAIAVADALHIDRATSLPALAASSVSPMRMDVTKIGHVTLINDAYNANEGSMSAALRTLAAMGVERRIAILGMVHDLGDEAPTILGRIGALSKELGIDTLISVCAPDTYRRGRSDTLETSSIEDAVRCTLTQLDELPTAILAKGSRVEGLERIIAALTTHLESAE